jgi:hypothetical protein
VQVPHAGERSRSGDDSLVRLSLMMLLDTMDMARALLGLSPEISPITCRANMGRTFLRPKVELDKYTYYCKQLPNTYTKRSATRCRTYVIH